MKLLVVVFGALAAMATAEFDEDLHDKYLTMSESDFIEYFNSQDHSWKMAQYDHIHDKYIARADFDRDNIENLPLLIHDLEGIELPDNFDAREHWPQCETIKEIYNQGDCNSCWAFGSATTASDRSCIHKDIHVRLSEQDLQCVNQKPCKYGSPEDAFDYWRDHGLVTDKCKPYDVDKLNKSEPCVMECVNPDINYKQDKHFAENIYRISNESDQIRAELFKNGPIETVFVVYEDFKKYESGIYVIKVPTVIGVHSVRVIGYGVEDGIDYWLAANSWGSNWGENGYFRTKRYQESLFENHLMTGMPKN